MQRPTHIEQVLERLKHFRSPEARNAAAELRARDSDVFIATYSKSGTTWMQQIVQQLRSGGATDFGEISEVVPWLESAIDMDIDPHAEQRWKPRAFKSHLLYSELPKGGRYITIFRAPETVLTSFYRFFEGWWFEPGTITIETFARELYLQGSAAGGHWGHFVDWWPKINAADTLALCYEDMLAAPDQVPALVADFLGLSLDDATMKKVIRQCSRDYMLAHSSQFDDHLIRQHRDAIWGLPPGGNSSKVTGRRDTALSPELIAELRQVWQDSVTAALGFADYPQLRRALPNPLGVSRD